MPREKGWQIPRDTTKKKRGKKKSVFERTMEVREQVSTLSWKMKSPFHAARAAELWNSFPVGGSGGKRGKELRGRAPSLPEGMGRGAADGSTWQDPMAQSPSRSGFLGPEVGWGKERLRSNRCSPQL